MTLIGRQHFAVHHLAVQFQVVRNADAAGLNRFLRDDRRIFCLNQARSKSVCVVGFSAFGINYADKYLYFLLLLIFL